MPAKTTLWVAAERLPQINADLSDRRSWSHRSSRPKASARTTWTSEDALVELLRGRLEGLGPVTVEQLVDSSGLNKLRDRNCVC